MTPVKTYQNVSYKELLAFSEQNPHRTANLKIEEVKQTEDNRLHKFDLEDYISSVVQPAGILGICTCITDPNYYYLAPQNVRTQMLIELTTKLQEKTEELKTSAISRKRRKIYDLIGAAYNNPILSDKDTVELVSGISFLSNLQFILIKEAVQENIEDDSKQYESALQGEIIFGSNPIQWKKEYPIWIIDYRGRWIAMPQSVAPDHIYTIVGEWLLSIQQKGWIIQWPEIDATKTELVQQLMQYPSWKETDRKLSKDTLAVYLGKAQTLQTFASWE